MTNHYNVLNVPLQGGVSESLAANTTAKAFDPRTRHYYEQFPPDQLVDFLLQRDEHIAELIEQMEVIGAGGVSLMRTSTKPKVDRCASDCSGSSGGYSPVLTDTDIDKHIDQLLVASGSSLKNYSMQQAIDRMRGAMRDAERAVIEAFKRRLTVVGYATHHDDPLVFPTIKEAAVFCDTDEEPVPLMADFSASTKEANTARAKEPRK
ncbi:hypothetical protein ACMHYO_16000 [Allopusillimonas ginsengisoli]|uniref:hypothetical protein n=1 Tax=Allopusillimonas ginsengisoli TaxID=453575 RepID=UPI0039C24F1B